MLFQVVALFVKGNAFEIEAEGMPVDERDNFQGNEGKACTVVQEGAYGEWNPLTGQARAEEGRSSALFVVVHVEGKALSGGFGLDLQSLIEV